MMERAASKKILFLGVVAVIAVLLFHNAILTFASNVLTNYTFWGSHCYGFIANCRGGSVSITPAVITEGESATITWETGGFVLFPFIQTSPFGSDVGYVDDSHGSITVVPDEPGTYTYTIGDYPPTPWLFFLYIPLGLLPLPVAFDSADLVVEPVEDPLPAPPACGTNAHPAEGGCVCDTGYTQVTGGACVADACTNEFSFPGIQTSVPQHCVQDSMHICTAAAGYMVQNGQCVVAALPPSNLMLEAVPARINKGGSVTLRWSGQNLPAACTLSTAPSLPGFPQTVPSGPTGSATGVSSGAVQQATTFTLTCSSASDSLLVGFWPVYQEI